MLETIYWYEMQVITFSRKPLEQMLEKDGFIIKEKCLLKGENRKVNLSKERYVIYDKNYVIVYMKTKLVLPLMLPEQKIIDLIKECYPL